MKKAAPLQQMIGLLQPADPSLPSTEMDSLITLLGRYREAKDLESRVRWGDKLAEAIRPRLDLYIKHRIAKRWAADALQQTLRDVFKGLAGFKGESDSKFRGWCYVIARRRIADLLRGKEYQVVEPLDAEALWKSLEASGESDPMSASDRADYKTIINFLKTMKGPCFNYLRSRYLLGMDWESMGEEYEVSADAVRMATKRCLESVRRQLGE